jgi:hypothetical protein
MYRLKGIFEINDWPFTIICQFNVYIPNWMNILQALEQICQCPRVSIDKFIDKIVPMLLGSAQPCLELTEDDKPYEDRFAIIF